MFQIRFVHAPIRVGLRIAAFGLAFFPIATACSESPPSPSLVKAGEERFQQYCSSCHGNDAKGNGPASRALRVAPPDLTGIAARRGGTFPSADIAKFVDGRSELAAHGSREMPIWGKTFQDKYGSGDIADSAVQGDIVVLIEYLRSIQE